MGQSPSAGTTVGLGEIGGHATITLAQNQIPAHTHSLVVNNVQSTTNVPVSGQTIAAPNTPAGRSTTPTNGFVNGSANTVLDQSSIAANTGGGQPHDNMQPYLGLNYIICVNGTFPPKQ
jgi:microcystin-dependent protein